MCGLRFYGEIVMVFGYDWCFDKFYMYDLEVDIVEWVVYDLMV